MGDPLPTCHRLVKIYGHFFQADLVPLADFGNLH